MDLINAKGLRMPKLGLGTWHRAFLADYHELVAVVRKHGVSTAQKWLPKNNRFISPGLALVWDKPA